MSLNTINLETSTLLAFYKKSLVEIGEIIAEKEPLAIAKADISPDTSLQYLGKNLKNVTILVNYSHQVYLPEEQLSFLTTILKACQLNIGDIAIVNTSKQVIDFTRIINTLSPRQMIMFGDFTNITGEMGHFIIKDLMGVTLLTAPELEILNKNTDIGKGLKGKLWLCLKQLFNV